MHFFGGGGSSRKRRLRVLQVVQNGGVPQQARENCPRTVWVIPFHLRSMEVNVPAKSSPWGSEEVPCDAEMEV